MHDRSCTRNQGLTEKDRRGSTRRRVELPVRFWSDLLEFEGQLAFGEISDVSDGGLFIRSDLLEPPGTPVSLMVTLERGCQMLKGQVAWIAQDPPKGPGMGIELAEVSRSLWNLIV